MEVQVPPFPLPRAWASQRPRSILPIAHPPKPSSIPSRFIVLLDDDLPPPPLCEHGDPRSSLHGDSSAPPRRKIARSVGPGDAQASPRRQGYGAFPELPRPVRGDVHCPKTDTPARTVRDDVHHGMIEERNGIFAAMPKLSAVPVLPLAVSQPDHLPPEHYGEAVICRPFKSTAAVDGLVGNGNGENKSQVTLASGETPTTSRGTCARKRRMSFAVRDYPEGCGRRNNDARMESPKPAGERFAQHGRKDFGKDRARKSPTKSLALASLTGMPRLGSESKKPNVNVPRISNISPVEELHSNDKENGAVCLYKGPSASQHRQGAKDFWRAEKRHKSMTSRFPDSSGRGELHAHKAHKKLELMPLVARLQSVKAQPAKKAKLTHPSPSDYTRMLIPCHSEGITRYKDLAELDSELSPRAAVKYTLHKFGSIRRNTANSQEHCKRPDLYAAKALRQKGLWRNTGERIIGEVPGVEVGDEFSFRIEMFIIGLHRQIQGGIDFISGKFRANGRPIATSIVASGGYEDDADGGDVFIYTGSGGNNYKGDKRQAKDQKLVRGNLALSNNHKTRTPVRVIRGYPDPSSPSKHVYTYDGLYDVLDYWYKLGLSGFRVFQFKLARQPGQPELGSSIVKFVGKLQKTGLHRPFLLLNDLSEGKERLPVCVVNEVDDEKHPAHFTYVPQMKYPSSHSPPPPRGCDCVDGCVDVEKCFCAAKNGGEFVYNEIGQVLWHKPVLYECGKSCLCPPSCHNRSSQRGLRYQLEVFKTGSKGWGVRSLVSIQPGGVVCEYTGELLSDAEAERKVGDDEYLFDIGNKWNPWDDISELVDVRPQSAVCPVVEDAGYTIDAKRFGNVARFINHSCSPNLYLQNVLVDCDDLRFPHVMLIAMENIPPMRELTYDYHYTVGHVRDEHNNVKTKACYCGASGCGGRLY